MVFLSMGCEGTKCSESRLLCSVHGVDVLATYKSWMHHPTAYTSAQMSHQSQWMVVHLLMSQQMSVLEMSNLTKCMVSPVPLHD